MIGKKSSLAVFKVFQEFHQFLVIDIAKHGIWLITIAGPA
jgi:hypothetical protein